MKPQVASERPSYYLLVADGVFELLSFAFAVELSLAEASRNSKAAGTLIHAREALLALRRQWEDCFKEAGL